MVFMVQWPEAKKIRTSFNNDACNEYYRPHIVIHLPTDPKPPRLHLVLRLTQCIPFHKTTKHSNSNAKSSAHAAAGPVVSTATRSKQLSS